MNNIRQNQTEKESRSGVTGLTPQQEKAAILLASGNSVVSVAEELNVSRGTLYEWKKLLTFQCYMNEQKQGYVDSLRGGIMNLAEEAIGAIRESLNSDNEQVRLKAAMWVADKVKDYQVGQTDAREAVKQECTTEMFDGWGEKIDEDEYKRRLKELGLK